MSDKAQRLKMAIGGKHQTALVEVLKSELTALLSQYLTVEDVRVSITESGLDIKVGGRDIKNVGFYWGN